MSSDKVKQLRKNNEIYKQKLAKENEEELKRFHKKIEKAIDTTYSRLEDYSKKRLQCSNCYRIK